MMPQENTRKMRKRLEENGDEETPGNNRRPSRYTIARDILANMERTASRLERPEPVYAGFHIEFSHDSFELTPIILEENMKILEWRCYATSSERNSKNCTLFLSVGQGNVYFLDEASSWVNVSALNVKLDLPAKTLLFGELVSEFHGEGDAQTCIKALHVMDAHMLDGHRVGYFGFDARVGLCKLFAQNHDKPLRTDLARICVKEVFTLDNLDPLFEKINSKRIKQCGGARKVCYVLDDSEDKFFTVGGIMFLKVVLDPWTVSFSKTCSRKYYFNLQNGTSQFDCHPDSVLSFSGTARVNWWWDEEVNLAMGVDERTLDPSIVHRVNLFEKFIEKN